MSNESWQCPYCQHFSVITEEIHLNDENRLLDSVDGKTKIFIAQYVCPNPNCRKMSLGAWLQEVEWTATGERYGKIIEVWKLRPASHAKPQPDYIPEPLRQDYKESCLISELSPKASATLSRRCLQGMIRDFHKILRNTLFEEINELKGKIDQGVWESIDAIRKVGNIGAHMEQDINIIVDVEPDEARLLIALIEQLFNEWYVARYEREQRIASVTALAQKKGSIKIGP